MSTGFGQSLLRMKRFFLFTRPLTYFFVFVLATSCAKEEGTNEVAPHPPINLDSNLRKALLKALTELENEEKAKNQQPRLDTRDKVVEKASASAVSFFTDTSTESTVTTTEQATTKPIVVIQKSNSLQHRPITTVEKYIRPLSDSEQFLTSASSNFPSSDKFSYTKTEQERKSSSRNLVFNPAKTSRILRPQKIETTTATTTTSTEESEAKVEDVQFFSAPLVAAFTVHQDERGLPRSVEPIFKPKTEHQKVKETKFSQEQLRTQFALHEKQRALEEEIARLRQQQQQQNYLIRQQQILHEQQLQLQKQKILEEQARIRNNQHALVPTFTTNLHPPTQQRSNEFNRNVFKGSVVSFQPSVSLTSNEQRTGQLPLNAQQLPVKNAIDFHAPFTSSGSFQQFNYLSHQQPPLVNSVPSFNIVSSVQPQIPLTTPNHHRVFRQETGISFNSNGFNNNFNHFNQVPVQQQNRFFRSNGESTFITPSFNFNKAEPPVVNHHLNNLLYNSGIIRGKQQEDLNIVSKVLSLNHFGGDFRFASSNVNEQRLPAPPIKKV